MRKMALSKMESVHTVGTTISVTISMWLVRGSAEHKWQADTSRANPKHPDNTVELSWASTQQEMKLQHSTQRVELFPGAKSFFADWFSEHEWFLPWISLRILAAVLRCSSNKRRESAQSNERHIKNPLRTARSYRATVHKADIVPEPGRLFQIQSDCFCHSH